MIVFISPAKTFSKTDVSSDSRPYFEKQTSKLISKLKKLSIDEIKNKMNLSDALACDVYGYYKHFNKHLTKAIFTYDGYQYKAIHALSYHPSDLSYLNQHVYIVSGLYGLVKPNDSISPYRLEMKDKSVCDLYAFWKPHFAKYMKTYHQNDILIDLMSTEYRKAFNGIPMIHIDFYERKGNDLKSISMHVKKMRGLFLKTIVQNRIETINELKEIVIDQYIFNNELSNESHLIFVKEE
jgi:cytoplasmic iron level regulating protein YaaA (DUF328/UPF0246 family)